MRRGLRYKVERELRGLRTNIEDRSTRTFVLEGSETGSATAIPLSFGGGLELSDASVGIPASELMEAADIGISWLSDSPPASGWTLRLKARDDTGAMAEIASFSIPLLA